MSAITVRIPESLHRHLKDAAKDDGVSVNQFISIAVAEKLAALKTYDLLTSRSEKGSKEAFLEALAAVPNVEPDQGDELPEGYIRRD